MIVTAKLCAMGVNKFIVTLLTLSSLKRKQSGKIMLMLTQRPLETPLSVILKASKKVNQFTCWGHSVSA